jgi:hypothetical protein
LSLETKVVGFPDLGLKTGRYSLMVWASKSPQRFLGLSLKTKWEEVYQFTPQNKLADEDGVMTHVDIRRLTS